MKRQLGKWIVICFIAQATTVLAAGLMSVQVKEGRLRSSPSFLGQPVASVEYGVQVNLLSSRGPWRQVRSPSGETGWIHESALTRKRVVFKSGEKDVGTTASGEELALAGKGFSSDVEAEFKERHHDMDFSWIDRMETMKISIREIQKFLKAGGLGGGE